SDMAESIQDRDRRLRDAVEQKSILISEIHHRVKNNLQVVMSLLSLQAGQIREASAREALLQAQVRISALALVHRILHEIEYQSTVDVGRVKNAMHQSERADSHLGLQQGLPRGSFADLTCLQTKQAHDHLEIILHAMMDFADEDGLLFDSIAQPAIAVLN